MKIQELGEIGLIDRIARQTKTDRSVIKGIGDDTAVLKYSEKEYQLFTTDMFLEGVHFPKLLNTSQVKEVSYTCEVKKMSEVPSYSRSETSDVSSEVSLRTRFFYNIGWKSLACNISDIAAMGGVPQHCLISVGLPANLEWKFVSQLYAGIKKIAQQFKINIVGGDTIKSPKLVINIALLGKVKKRNLVLRSGAKKGDAVLVTGSLGRAILCKHLTFVPRLKEAQYLVNNFKIHSMIDISDGLVLDLSRILKQSKKGAKICLEKIPISAAAKRGKDGLKKALYDGEDFELLFTATKNTAKKIVSEKLAHIIGEITDKKNILESSDGKRLKINGYQHF